MKARNVYFFFPPACVPLVLAEAHLSFARFTESGRMIEPHPHSFIHLFFFLCHWEWCIPRGTGFDSFANALRDCGLHSMTGSRPSVLHDVLHCTSDLAMQLPGLTENTVLEVSLLTEILHQLPETLSGQLKASTYRVTKDHREQCGSGERQDSSFASWGCFKMKYKMLCEYSMLLWIFFVHLRNIFAF